MSSENRLKIETFVSGHLFTNTYLVFDERTKQGVLVDPAEHSDAVTRCIASNNLNMAGIINTHGHCDHIMGDPYYDLPVYIHKADRICLTDSSRSLLFTVSDKALAPVKEVKLLEEGDIFKLGEEELQIIHTPGHSPGGISIKYNGILFSGDTLFFEGVGRTDLPGGDHNALVRSITEKLFVLPDETRVFPGHGAPTTIGHEKEFAII